MASCILIESCGLRLLRVVRGYEIHIYNLSTNRWILKYRCSTLPVAYKLFNCTLNRNKKMVFNGK